MDMPAPDFPYRIDVEEQIPLPARFRHFQRVIRVRVLGAQRIETVFQSDFQNLSETPAPSDRRNDNIALQGRFIARFMSGIAIHGAKTTGGKPK